MDNLIDALLQLEGIKYSAIQILAPQVLQHLEGLVMAVDGTNDDIHMLAEELGEVAKDMAEDDGFHEEQLRVMFDMLKLLRTTLRDVHVA